MLLLSENTAVTGHCAIYIHDVGEAGERTRSCSLIPSPTSVLAKLKAEWLAGNKTVM